MKYHEIWVPQGEEETLVIRSVFFVILARWHGLWDDPDISGLRAGSSVPVIQDLDLYQNKLTAEQFEAPDAKLR